MESLSVTSANNEGLAHTRSLSHSSFTVCELVLRRAQQMRMHTKCFDLWKNVFPNIFSKIFFFSTL